MMIAPKATACGRDDLFFVAFHSILGGQLDICGRNGLFFALHLMWVESWTSANVITFKEPVFLLYSEIWQPQ